MNNDVLEFNDVWKTYKMGAEDIQALRGVNLTVNRG